jgi:hypothetical protein
VNKIKELMFSITALLHKHYIKIEWAFLFIICMFLISDVALGNILMTLLDLVVITMVGAYLHEHYYGDSKEK